MPSHVSDGHPDMALVPFLAFLERDLTTRPVEAARPLTDALTRRLDALSAMIGPVDLRIPLKSAADSDAMSAGHSD